MKNEAAAIELLIDAMIMFEDIQKARELPPFANAQQQYIAMGKSIRLFLKDEGKL
jgi:hypothetical protein